VSRVRNAALSQAEVVETQTGWVCCDSGLTPGFTGEVPWQCAYYGAGCDHICISYGNAVTHAAEYHVGRRKRPDVVHTPQRTLEDAA